METHSYTSVDCRRVLIIDESTACRSDIRRHLALDDYLLDEAETGFRGLELARACRPHLILLNMHLSDLDGFDVLRQLKNESATRNIPIVLLSGTASTETKARGLDLGAVDFLSKPTDPVELRARVRAAVRAKYLQDLLEERAHLDGLTGLGNRFALDERLEAAWQLCRRRGTPLTLLLADLDHFKRINDEYGHSSGDEILRRAAEILRTCVRGCDFVGRYGGEEFVVVAPDCSLDGGIMMAERFRAELSAPMGAGYQLLPFPVTTTIGLAEADSEDCTTPQILLSRADRSLYRGKSAGRDTVWYWSGPLHRPVPARESSRPNLFALPLAPGCAV